MKVYLMHVTQAELIPDEYCLSNFPIRYARAKKYRQKNDYLRCIGAGALLSGILNINEQNIQYGKYGKPETEDHSIHFCLSHSGEYIVLSEDTDEVGVDIEVIDRSHISTAGILYTNDEQEWMTHDPLNRFFILWTLKEAVMKQSGKGFNLSPRTFSVLPLIDGKSINADGIDLYAKSLFIGTHALSVCTAHEIEDIKITNVTYKDVQ